jgi:hypothetical protein
MRQRAARCKLAGGNAARTSAQLTIRSRKLQLHAALAAAERSRREHDGARHHRGGPRDDGHYDGHRRLRRRRTGRRRRAVDGRRRRRQRRGQRQEEQAGEEGAAGAVRGVDAAVELRGDAVAAGIALDVGGQPRSAALAAVLDGLSSTRGAGKSFTTLRLVYDDALAKFRPGQPNSVLVITGGGHSDRSLDGQGLQDYVKSAVDRDRPVMINVIDVGDDPDRADWEAVVQISGGTYQSVPPDSPALMAAIARAIS